MMTLALRHSEISKLAPFEYLSLIFAVIGDFVLFSVVPDGAFHLSTLMIVVAMWAIAVRERTPMTRKAGKRRTLLGQR